MDESGRYGLHLLPYPETHWELKHGEPTLDIVAVHGLNGSPSQTWTYSKPNADDSAAVHWLKDLLFYKVPRIRVMTFGYNANIRATTTLEGIRENARSLLSLLFGVRSKNESNRPIIWICHGLGGVVVKQALIICLEDPKYEPLSSSSSMVMFFGTPHRQSVSTSWEDLLLSISQTTLLRVDNHSDYRKINPRDLIEVSNSFLPIASHFQIVCFSEELPHPRVGSVVVDRSCAVLQTSNEETVLMTNSDHSSMCTFASTEDLGFADVWKRILKLSRSVTRVPSESSDIPAFPRRVLKTSPTAELSTTQIDCLASLFMKDPQDIREAAFALRYPGTNQWLAHTMEYSKWKTDEQKSLLWILGGPGYGKTVLATTVLDDLDHRDDYVYKDSLLAYFFWDDKDDSRNTASAMYRSVIWQLLRQQPQLFKHVLPDFEIQQHRLFESLQSLARLFKNIISDPCFPAVFLVLDALDECEADSRDFLLAQISRRFSSQEDETAPRLKLFITSRIYDGIRGDLSHHPTLTLTPQILQGDIALFVNGKVAEIASVRKYPPALAKKVYNVVCEGAHGMFLWCAMILGELRKTPLLAVEKKLKSLPQGLHAMYDSILKNIPPDARETAVYILQWVIATVRPLTLRELSFAMGTHYAMTHEGSSAPFEYSIEGDINLCGPILAIRQGRIHLIHQSAKDFLTQNLHSASCYPSLEELSIDMSEAHKMVALTCLAYLRSEEFASGTIDIKYRYGNEEVLQRQFESFPFLEYSAAHWLHHAGLCQEHEEINRSIDLFDWPETKKFIAWFQIFWYSQELYLPYPTQVTPYHIAAHFHLPHYLATRLQPVHINDLEPTYYGTLIHAASWAGNLESVDLLFKLGADVDIIGGRYGTALQAAAGNGHEVIVRKLLSYKATINLTEQSGAHGTALQAASLRGFNGIVRLLLKMGADVNTNRADGCFGIALRGAAKNGHHSIVQRLLRADADVHAHAQGVDYGTALQRAAEGGDEATVELLLTAGMDSNSKIKSSKLYDFGTALQAAVATGQIETVKLLLDAKADVDAPGPRNGTALTIAASSGHLALVDLLIKAGAQVSKVSGGYGTPLIAAARAGKENVVQQLLKYGADPNERGGFYNNALRAAVSEGHPQVVKLLLEAGAKDNLDDVYGDSILGLVKRHGEGNVLSTILEHVVMKGDLVGDVGTLKNLLDLLNGDWRGYYYYAAGNRARDEGEVFFTLKSSAQVEKEENTTEAEKEEDEVLIEGRGEDKWGPFEIKGTANIKAEISFEKNYKAWGWNYRGKLSLSERAMAGQWGRDNQDTHGTFAFHQV